MGMLSTVRPVPGQLGGGLGRVVEVRDLPGSRTSAGGLRTVQAVLEKPSTPLNHAFSDVLAQFNGDDTEKAAAPITLSTTVVTTVQEYSTAPAVAPAAAAQPAEKAGQASLDDTSTQTVDDSQKDTTPQDQTEEQKMLAEFLKDLLPALGEMPDKAATTSLPDMAPAATQLLGSNGDLFSRMRLAASAYAGLVNSATADASASA